MTKKWPKEVPILGPEDIARGSFGTSDGRKCLIGWLSDVFSPGGCYTGARLAVSDVVREGKIPPGDLIGVGDFDIILYNDTCLTKKEVANTWNKAMRNLGYTEVSDAS